MSTETFHTASESPQYEHDCHGCHFLGRHDTPSVDLYVCNTVHNRSTGPTVLARYGSLGHQYTSGLTFAPHNPWLGEAKRRAIEQGFLSDEHVTGEER